MLDPFDYKHRPLVDTLERRRRLVTFILLLERLTLCLWRPAAWFMLFAGLWMFQIPAMLGNGLPVLSVVVFVPGFLYFLFSDFRKFRFPSAEHIDRRIEADSKIRHRPIATLKDKLSNPEKTDTRNLWTASRMHTVLMLPALKVGHPKALLASRDPRALRLAALMFFILGMAVSGPNWNERIIDGLTPLTFDEGVQADDDINLWITPPEYTRLEQVILKGTGKNVDKLMIPAGSIVKVRIHGGIGEPALFIDERSRTLKKAENDNYLLEMKIVPGQTLSIRQMMMTRAKWNFELVHDSAPTITMKGEPEELSGGPVRFPMMVFDDYGVKTLDVNMHLDPSVEDAPLGKPFHETRSIMSPAKSEFEIQPVYDLTSHPWAGLPVLLTFTVQDHLGQKAVSTEVAMTLPERSFTHPVAKALIEFRKQLTWNPASDYEKIGRQIESLLTIPDSYQHDIVVFLAIRSAASRLLHANPPTAGIAESLISLLWDTALRIEDGNLTLAARHVRDMQAALENALKNLDTPNEEIAELMRKLRESMAEFFTEMQRELQKRMAEGENMPMIPPEMMSQIINPDALADFIDQMEAQILSGDRQSAQEMLSQLQRMMDTMDPSMAAPMPPDMQMMSEGISELQQLIEQQEELLNQTRTQLEMLDTLSGAAPDYGDLLPPDTEAIEELEMGEMPPLPEAPEQLARPAINTKENGAEQEALRFILGQLMLRAGETLEEIPKNMGMAEREMHNSAGALTSNMPDISIPHQEAALEYLKESQQQLSQQMMARMQQMGGMSFSAGGMRYDPLGRPYGGEENEGGMFPGSRVKIPEESERKKAQEILRLLRRRSGELDRPDEELDYFQRLLRQF